MHEARFEETEAGRIPADDGWFIVNAADIGWETVPGGGTWCGLGPSSNAQGTVGVGVHVLPPGHSTGFYHVESNQEGFFVLEGECLVIVEGEERRMGQWDYFHSPPGTAHIIVGASDPPCAVFMLGARSPDTAVRYIPDPVAARHGVAVETETDSGREAYKDRPPIVPARAPWPVRPR